MDRRKFVQASLATAATLGFAGRAAGAQARFRIQADVVAAGMNGDEVVLAKAAVRELAESLNGSCMLPGASGYETARSVWNGVFDRKPALIAQCSGPADVVQAVNFAR